MTQKKHGTIIKVSGPLVVAKGMKDAQMREVVKVSDKNLTGEIIKLEGDMAFIQVYEETTGIGPGEPVYQTGKPLTVELGPGLLTSFYDGIQRPLDRIYEQTGAFITRGIEVCGLDRGKKWNFRPVVEKGKEVSGGDILGEVQETELITHRVLVPPGVSGAVEEIKSGEFTVIETICTIGKSDVSMMQIWPVRQPRPVKRKILPDKPMATGQRVIDAFFPIAQGGTASMPGPSGAGKTVVQHQIAKWADADIIVFVGCAKRGNEMTDILREFSELIDPKTRKPKILKTVLVANTQDMPVAAREASVYTGITIAEYFRDMGYRVAFIIDSTSRWAEALREISSRLEEMPADVGYPAYLGSRTAAFYERSGAARCLGSENRKGSLTVIGAVSPPGGDLSEPVTQNTLRVTKVFWSLDSTLACKRHFPAINWLTSYSLYLDNISDSMKQQTGDDWPDIRKEAMGLLQKEAQLREIARLLGVESLSPKEQLILDTTKSIREDFLHQNAFDKIDAHTSLYKMYLMLKAILAFYHQGLKAIETGKSLKDIIANPLKEEISKSKMVKEDELRKLENVVERVENVNF